MTADKKYTISDLPITGCTVCSRWGYGTPPRCFCGGEVRESRLGAPSDFAWVIGRGPEFTLVPPHTWTPVTTTPPSRARWILKRVRRWLQ